MSCNSGYGVTIPFTFQTEAGEKFELVPPETVRDLLPHQGIALRIDSAQYFGPSSRIVAYRLLTESDYDFEGHFPGKPVLPGAIQIEIAAQAAVLLAKKKYPYIKDLPLLTRVREVRFKHPAVPGDVLSISVSLAEEKAKNSRRHPLEFSFVIGKKTANGEKRVSSGHFEGMAFRS